MAARKTVEVEALKDRVNFMLDTSKCSNEYKAGVCSLMEHILSLSGNYKGFSYLRVDPAERNADGYIDGEIAEEYARRYF